MTQPAAATFDEILAQLRHIVAQLERGDRPLEDALTLYEQGVNLTRLGQSLLESAEKRVEHLTQLRATALVEEAPAKGP